MCKDMNQLWLVFFLVAVPSGEWLRVSDMKTWRP